MIETTLPRAVGGGLRHLRWVLLLVASACAEVPTAPEPAAGLAFARVTLDVGRLSTCALDVNGQAWCWGTNYRGQLGNGTTADSPTPTRVAGDHTFVAVSVNDWTNCALDNAGAAWCWGDNQGGQLGAGWHKGPQDGLLAFSALPERVISPKPFIALAAAGVHNCALAADSTAYCWGSNSRGGIGTATPGLQNDTAILVSPTLRFRALKAGGFSVCGIVRGGEAYCWGGDDGYGVLGNGSIGQRSSPTPVAGGLRWTSIEPDQYVACGVAAAQLYCWGAISGTTGGRISVPDPTPSPQLIATGGQVRSLGRNCMTFRVGDAACLSSVTDSSRNRFSATTRSVPGTLDFVRVVGSQFHACGQVADGRLYCWGDNTFGQIGDGTTSRREVPVLVAGNVAWSTAGADD